jgi:ATP-dependent helicase/nuclease subunit A
MPKWTTSQEEAITTQESKNILVSASAGSGKTAVLENRVLTKVKSGIPLSALFISTFTVKAAAELRVRIEKSLKRSLSEEKDPHMQGLLTQALEELPLADIGTMDAFSNRLVKQYYQLVGLDPNYRILTDISEQSILKKEIFDALLENFLSGSAEELSPEAFETLAQNFSNDRNLDGLYSAVDKLYSFTQATENPEKWLEEVYLKAFEHYQSFSDLPDELKGSITEVQDAFDCLFEAAEEALDNGAATGKTKEKIENILTIAPEIQKWVEDSAYENLSELILSEDMMRWQAKKDERFTEIYKEIMGTATNPGILRRFVGLIKHAAVIEKIQPQGKEIAISLRTLVRHFTRDYESRKKELNAYEYSDIAHFAIEILENNPEVRENFQKKYQELLIDEYQDTSHTQERLITLLSSGNNVFQVGDIKQSIYGFRLADSELFNQKYQSYGLDENPNKLIRLKENFRSRKEVLDFTNEVFERLMAPDLYKVDYGPEEALVYGGEHAGTDDFELPTDVDARAELLLYQSEGDSEEEESLPEGEIALAAAEIIRLINLGVSPDSIALLVRSRTNNNTIEDVFRAHDIPVAFDDGRVDYLKSIEVQVMLDVLRAINNPRFDLPLVALMHSPMFDFGEDELARIRLQGGSDLTFWERVELALGETRSELIDTPLYTKLTDFTERFTAWRNYAKTLAIHELVWKILTETYYFDFVGALPNGEQRQANLEALTSRAQAYEAAGYKGLTRFISLIDDFLKQHNDLESITVKLPQKAVRVLTIHKAKGLQFDYVFVMGMETKFNRRDLVAPVILDREEGIGLQVIADLAKEVVTDFPYARVKVETLPWRVNRARHEKELYAEDMRLLYVAFTRAVKKLYMVGKVKNAEDVAAYESVNADGLLDYDLRASASKGFLGWILALNGGTRGNLKSLKFDGPKTEVVIDAIRPEHLSNLTAAAKDLSNLTEVADELAAAKKILDYDYDKAAVNLPSTQSPSLMKKRYQRLLDESDITESNQKFELNLGPRRGFSATEIGSAVHSFMQNINFAQMDLFSFQAVLDSLHIPDALKKEIQVDKYLTFAETDLGKCLAEHAATVQKEAPFSMLKTDPASKEQFVVRGIVDGYLELPERIILFDYKTDRFNGKNTTVIRERYAMQMAIYADALEKAFEKPVEKWLILLGGPEKVLVEKLS